MAFIEIYVGSQQAFGMVEGIVGTNSPDKGRIRIVAPEAAAIEGVVRDESWSWRPDSSQRRVIRYACEVHRCLLGVSEVKIRKLSARNEAGIACDGVRQVHSFIERAEKYRLPPAARESRDGHSLRIRIRLCEQDIECAALREIVKRDPVGARKIDLICAVVMEVIQFQLAHPVPLKIEREHTAFCEIDASDLNVRSGGSRTFVPVDVQHHWYFPAELFRLVQITGNPEARNCLEPEF